MERYAKMEKELKESERKYNNQLEANKELLERIQSNEKQIQEYTLIINQLQNTNKEPQDKLNRELGKSKELKTSNMIEEAKEVVDEDLAITQIQIKLDTPPDKELEDRFIEICNELDMGRKKILILNKTIEELEISTKEARQELKEEKTKYELESKKHKLILESLENKCKESKLDLIKANSIILRKETEIEKLSSIIKQLESQKLELTNAVILY